VTTARQLLHPIHLHNPDGQLRETAVKWWEESVIERLDIDEAAPPRMLQKRWTAYPHGEYGADAGEIWTPGEPLPHGDKTHILELVVTDGQDEDTQVNAEEAGSDGSVPSPHRD
jgi:hypothetical protein